MRKTLPNNLNIQTQALANIEDPDQTASKVQSYQEFHNCQLLKRKYLLIRAHGLHNILFKAKTKKSRNGHHRHAWGV